MKKIAFAAFAAIAASASLSTAAQAGYYDDGYSSHRYTKHRHYDYDRDYCYTKKIAYYDDYGYVHYKRVRVCE